MQRLYVTLTDETFNKLAERCGRTRRRPGDEAGLVLERALGLLAEGALGVERLPIEDGCKQSSKTDPSKETTE